MIVNRIEFTDDLVDEEGQTWEEWVEHLFEYEFCAECGGDAKDHEPWFLWGHWFAHCKNVEVET